jgi:hypothetical protein
MAVHARGAMIAPKTGDRAQRALRAALIVYVEKVLGEAAQPTEETDQPDPVDARHPRLVAP